LQAVPSPLQLSGFWSGSGLITGINLSTTLFSSGILGMATATTGNTVGGFFVSKSTAGTGVIAESEGPTGILAYSKRTSGTTYGGYFTTSSPLGRSVVAHATSQTGAPYAGLFVNDGVDGIGVLANSSGIYGVLGTSTRSFGAAVGGEFTSASNEGIGCRGSAFSTSGFTYGGFMEVHSPDGIAVRGANFATSGFGFGGNFSVASNGNGRAVYGAALTTAPSSTSDGVRGFANAVTNGFAVYSNGDFGASGFKAFQIDHPFDIEGKYLLHYSTESPFPQNFYSGNVTTDAQGYAWVELPDYFSEINTNYKYQLTVIDSSDDFVMAKVTREIEENRFQVRTSKGGVKVSWRVEADRNDAYTRFKRPRDERPKIGDEVGTVQQPQIYGLPESKGIDSRVNLPPRPQAPEIGTLKSNPSSDGAHWRSRVAKR
jgi:hypothetical protein